MRREDLLEFFLGHLAELSALLLCRIASGFGCLVLGFLVVVIHGTAPFLDTEGFVATTVERSPLGIPGGHEREGSLNRLNPHYMEGEATYTAAWPAVSAPRGARRKIGTRIGTRRSITGRYRAG